jgi:hypothetical protein
MKARKDVFDTYWRFAAKRQDIFYNRLLGMPRPWTDDVILDRYKFCNVYRASDRVSQYLIRNVIYSGNRNEEETIFRILLFKIFNKIETWEYLLNVLGEIRLADFSIKKYGGILEERISNNVSIYSNAYISCATKAYGYDRKHMNHLTLIYNMIFKDRIADSIIRVKRFEEIFSAFRRYPLIGDFMAYQLMTDINYSEVINFDENDFTVVGPGSMRGINKCFEDRGGKSYEYIIKWTVENQENEFERLGLSFKTLWGRNLHCIDCQGLFCETDKYTRAAFPELLSNRVRIKAKFEPLHEKIDFFYPPKWNLNKNTGKDPGPP